MEPISQDQQRVIVEDFAHAIRERKISGPKPSTHVINFRDEKTNAKERQVWQVPLGLLRYRKDNGRIASDVMNYQKLNGPLDEIDEGTQAILRKFLEDKHPEMTETLIKSIEQNGQSEPAIVTCDGFLINGNRRKMALEYLGDHNKNEEKYKWMKVVILPAPGEEGGPPTLLEIEKLENRYQLQSEGKSEYYNFDRALSMKRKMQIGFSLEEQLRDDPRYARSNEQDLKKAVKEYERDYLQPLDCVDRYLESLDRSGMYGTVSAGIADKEGRWQAFIDFSHAYNGRLKNQQWQMSNGFDEEDLGAVEDAAFKLIRLRSLKGLPKVHQIMRRVPNICAMKESRKELLNISDEVASALPHEDQYDADGRPLLPDEIDKKWAHRSQQKLIMLTKKALEHVERFAERETTMSLLEAALKKLTHENLIVENISMSQYDEARRLAATISKTANDIEHQIYEQKKKLDVLQKKK